MITGASNMSCPPCASSLQTPRPCGNAVAPPEEAAQDGQSLGHPVLLIDSLTITVNAGNKEHQHRRSALLSLQDLGPLGHRSLLKSGGWYFWVNKSRSMPLLCRA